MIRMNVNRILPLMLLLVLFASCSRKYKVEGVSSVTSLDGKMLYLKTLRDGQWITIDSAEVVHGLFSTSGEMKYEEKNRFRVHFLIVGNNIVLSSKYCSRFGRVVFR